MTDNYDLDPHEHEAHAEEADQSKAEAWPDDQPPVDDFADPGAEETATSSEETGVHHEEIMDPEPRKSSALLPIIAGVGGLLFLGAVLYWQFGRSSSPPPSVPAPPPLQMAQAPLPKPVAAIGAPEIPVSGKETPPDLATLMKQATAPAPTTDVAPKTSYVAAGNPSAVMPTSSAAPSAAPAILPPPSMIAAPNTGSLETRVNNLSVRMDELKKELDQATQQLGQMNVALSSPSFGNASIEDRLAQIERQIKQVERAPNSAPTPAVAVSDSSPPSQPETAPEIKTPAVSVHKKTGAPKSSHKVSNQTVRPVVAHWVLRAATPTEAWVAKNESTTELRHIRIGDVLPGVGHINAIHQNGDGWVIEGSAGTIH